MGTDRKKKPHVPLWSAIFGAWTIISTFLGLPVWIMILVLIVVAQVLFHSTFLKKSDVELLTDKGLCVNCGFDLTQIGPGQLTCPNCGETIPAKLRKWGPN